MAISAKATLVVLLALALLAPATRAQTEDPEPAITEQPTGVQRPNTVTRRAIDTVRLRYRNGKFRGKWRGRKGPPDSMVFQLISLKDRWGNR